LTKAVQAIKWSSTFNISLEINRFNVSPADIAACLFPVASVVFKEIGVSGTFVGNLCSSVALDIGSNGLSGFSSLFTVDIIKSQEVIVGPSVHLNWENSCLMWKSFQTHLINPRLEIEAFNWWDSVGNLILLKDVVVLAWWVHTK